MINDLLSENVINTIKQEIEKNNGNEVFFVGKKNNSNGRISTIKACAWGNDNAVAIIYDEAYKGDYLIHNHPSGNLTPSENDILLSSHFGNQGIGFIIIDNEVSKYFTLVQAVDSFETIPLDSDELSEILSKEGPISKYLKDYEYRIGQIEMLKLICNSFNKNSISLIEAQTGTGKSLAYLIPAIFWSIKNKEKIVISTNTINLQEQLINKDIPFIKKALNINFNAVLVKGRNNYGCLRKINLILNENELFDDENEEYKSILKEWISNTKYGTKEEFFYKVNNELWEKISSESEECVKTKCPDFKDCFFFKARKEMNLANLLIVNHHILCSDISIKKSKLDYSRTALLPKYTKVIIDEAHNIEDAFSSYFGIKISKNVIKKTISRLIKINKRKSTGLLPLLEKKMYKKSTTYQIEKDFDKILNSIKLISSKILESNDYVDNFFNYISDYFNNKIKGSIETQLRLDEAFSQDDNYKELLNNSIFCLNHLREISNGLYRLSSLFNNISYYYIEDIYNEINLIHSLADKISNYAIEIEYILKCRDNSSVFWIEKTANKKNTTIYLNSSPIYIGDILVDYLFNTIDTIILTSATLSTGGNFNFLKNRIGLQNFSIKKLEEKIITSNFNYKEQTIFCIPQDISQPDLKSFEDEYCKYVEKILYITKGATFILCTSFNQIKKIKNYLEINIEFSFLNIFAQGDLDRSVLLEKFKKTPNSVLIGTDSFWEGVDVPGDDLKCVIIIKLPFKVPSEPIYQARAEKIEQEGKSSFFNYSLPLSVIKFKQGFGRLIRSNYDEGVIVCLDKRLITKSYGKYFFSSLPDLPIIVGNEDDIITKIKKFFR